MTSIKTPAGEILALRLPKDADDFGLDSRTNAVYWYLPDYGVIHLPEGNWQILGPISHKGEFGFDPTPFIPESTFRGKLKETSLYKEWARKEMLKVIESQGEILWSNPMGEMPVFDGRYDIISERYGEMDALRECERELNTWQSYEDKRVKDTELILIIVNR